MTTSTSTLALPPRLAATLAYAGWWLTGLIIWALERQDKYVRFHAAQSVAVFGTVALLVVGLALLAALSLSLVPGLFVPLLWAAGATWAVGILRWAVALWSAASGRVWRVPLAASLADRMGAVSPSRP